MFRDVIRRVGLILLLCLLLFSGVPTAYAQYQTPTTIPVPNPYELIMRVNWLRNGNGYAALTIDPVLMASAQAVAEGWAYGNYLDHSGNTREKLIAAGYGAGDVPWGTENIASGPNMSISDVLAGPWNDALHAIPWVNPLYKHIGAAIVEVNGKFFCLCFFTCIFHCSVKYVIKLTIVPSDSPISASSST